jgi:hypothetical protein
MHYTQLAKDYVIIVLLVADMDQQAQDCLSFNLIKWITPWYVPKLHSIFAVLVKDSR